MAKRAALIFAGALLVPIAIGAFLLFRDDGPRYNGRSLSQWIRANSQNPNDAQALGAIVAITTNSAPVLIRWLSRDTTSEERFETMLPSLVRTNIVISRWLNQQRYRAACSVRALLVSGTNAACAIPELAELLAHHNSPMVKIAAMRVLCSIGPAALPSLQQAMTNRDPVVRQMVVFGVGRLGTNAAPALPDLIAAQSDPDRNVRTEATNALQQISHEALMRPRSSSAAEQP